MRKLVFVLIGFSAWSCKKDDDDKSKMKVQPSMSRIAVQNVPELNLDTQYITNNVTIKSLKYPLANITISYVDPSIASSASGSNGFTVYQCGGKTNDECLVELSTDALQNILVNAPALDAKEGTFNTISLSPCAENDATKVRIKVTAEATINSVVYYTNVAAGLSTTGPAEEISIDPGFGCSSSFRLLESLVIGDGVFKSEPVVKKDGEAAAAAISASTIPVKLYFDIANITRVSLGTDNAGADGSVNGNFCAGTTQQNPYICLNFPDIAATVDTATPTVKKFVVSQTGTTGTFSPTILGFYFGSKSRPFGAHTRPFYEGRDYVGAIPQHLIGPMFKGFTENADGSIKVETYNDWMTFPAFKMEAHTGTVVLDVASLPEANPNSVLNGTFTYEATPL